MQTNISFSTWTIVKVILVLLAIWLLYIVRDVITMLFVAVILASIFDPVVDWFKKRKIPRALGVLFIYLVLFAILGIIISFVVPPVVSEIRELGRNFPALWERIILKFTDLKIYAEEQGFLQNIQQFLQSIESNLAGVGRGIFAGILSVFGGIVSFLIILVITFYLLTQENAVKGFFESIIPRPYQAYSFNFFSRFKKKLKYWAGGQLLLVLIVFILVYLGLLLLGVKYALVLALLAGILELVPYVGPVIAAIPAAFLGFTQDFFLGFLVIILFLLVQQLENHIIAPKIMQKTVGLNPIIVIIALIAGAKLGGIVGVLLAIPVALFISIFVQELLPASPENKK